MITKQNENSENIFERLNSALKRLGDEVVTCPDGCELLIPIYDCNEEIIRVVTREEFLELIRSYNCGKSDFVILGELFNGQTKTISEVVKEFFVQFESSDFNFFFRKIEL